MNTDGVQQPDATPPQPATRTTARFGFTALIVVLVAAGAMPV